MKRKDRWFNLFLLLVVGIACGAAFLLPQDEPAAALPVAALTERPAETYRKRRDAERALTISSLKTLLTSEWTDQTTRAAAQAQLLSLTERAETELALEAAAAGMGVDAVCAARGDIVVFSVGAALDSAQANGLISLAREWTGAAGENIRILTADVADD